MVLNLFGPESLRKMLPEVEQVACRKLQRWSSQDTVELKDATASVISPTVLHLIDYPPIVFLFGSNKSIFTDDI